MKKAKTRKDIENHPLLERDVCGNVNFEKEYDNGYVSYWGYLKAGYRISDNDQHTIHEDTIADFCKQLNNARVWKDDPDLNH